MKKIHRKTYGVSSNDELAELEESFGILASRVDQLNTLVEKLLQEELIAESTRAESDITFDLSCFNK